MIFESCVQLEISYQVSKTRMHNNLLQTEGPLRFGHKYCIVSSIFNILFKKLTETVNKPRTMPIYCIHTSSTQLHVMACAFDQRKLIWLFQWTFICHKQFCKRYFPSEAVLRKHHQMKDCLWICWPLRRRWQRRIWEIEWLMLLCVYRI